MSGKRSSFPKGYKHFQARQLAREAAHAAAEARGGKVGVCDFCKEWGTWIPVLVGKHQRTTKVLLVGVEPVEDGRVVVTQEGFRLLRRDAHVLPDVDAYRLHIPAFCKEQP